VFRTNPAINDYIRPLGDAEYDALLDRAGKRSPPGVPRPRIYPFIGVTISRDRQTIWRTVGTTTACRWEILVQLSFRGEPVDGGFEIYSDEALAEEMDGTICKDEISAGKPGPLLAHGGTS
jgi:hypothetical protein